VGIGDHIPSSLCNVESFRVYLLMVVGRDGSGRWKIKGNNHYAQARTSTAVEQPVGHREMSRCGTNLR
jgi:hypothetical protein